MRIKTVINTNSVVRRPDLKSEVAMNEEFQQEFEPKTEEAAVMTEERTDFSEKQQTKAYLKELRKTAGRCSFILLILLLSAQLLSGGIAYLLGMIQRSTGELPVSSDMLSYLTSYLPCLLGDIVAIILGIVLLSPSLKGILSARSQEPHQFSLLGTLACIGAGNIGAYLLMVVIGLLGSVGYSFQIPELPLPESNLLEQILCISYICVLGPVCEEILFRGVILQSLRKFGNMTAIIASSVMFAMFHMNPVQFMVPILVGLVLSYMTIQSKSIFPAILAHIANNTLRTLPVFFGDNLFVAGILSMLVVAFSIAAMIGLAVFILRYGRKFTDLLHHEDISLAGVGKKLWNITHAGWSIAYIVVFLGMSAYLLSAFIQKM